MTERVTHLLQIGRETLIRRFSEFIIKKRLGEALDEPGDISALGFPLEGREGGTFCSTAFSLDSSAILSSIC